MGGGAQPEFWSRHTRPTCPGPVVAQARDPNIAQKGPGAPGERWGRQEETLGSFTGDLTVASKVYP